MRKRDSIHIKQYPLVQRKRSGWLKYLSLLVTFLVVTDVSIFFLAPIHLLFPSITENEGQRTDAVAVLFHGFDNTGSRISRDSERRVRYGVSLLGKNEAPYIIFAGGNRPLDNKVGALFMADFARNLGVRDEKIKVETDSMDSIGNIGGIEKIISEMGLKKVFLVSSSYHLIRISSMMKRLPDGFSLRPYDPERTHPPLRRYDIWKSFHYNVVSYAFWVFLPASVYSDFVSVLRLYTDL